MAITLSRIRAVPPEVAFAAMLAAVTLGLSALFGLPFVLPGRDTTQFIGIHYFVPLLAILVWYGCCALFGERDRLGKLGVMLVCYAVVMWLHFTLKLWAHLINPRLFDSMFWSIDLQFRPVIDFCKATHGFLAGYVPDIDGLYLIGFIAMFFISFCFHAVKSPDIFRKLLLAAILFQGLGGLAYLVMPALGPFIYERGANMLVSQAQAGMLGAYRDMMAGGAGWLSINGSRNLAAGLAAMPSLHAGGSFLFLWFAWRYERPLLILYVPLFAFICVEAIASRWHYLIDLPVGILLARACIALAFRIDGRDDPRPDVGAAIPLFRSIWLAKLRRSRPANG